MGTGWKGRACCAKTKVARRAGGTGFSVKRISRYSGGMVRVGDPMWAGVGFRREGSSR